MKIITVLAVSSLCTILSFAGFGETTQSSKPILLTERGGGHGGGGRAGGGHHTVNHHSAYHAGANHRGAYHSGSGHYDNGHHYGQNNHPWAGNGFHNGWNGPHTINGATVNYYNNYPFGLNNGAYWLNGTSYANPTTFYAACVLVPGANCSPYAPSPVVVPRVVY